MKPPLSDPPAATEAQPSQFPLTHWTLVLTAGEGDSERAQAALRHLCVAYQRPILRCLQRWGHDEHKSADLAQGFMLHLLEKNRLRGFERTSVRFRSFLLECLKRFARDEWKKDNAEKRGGGREAVDFDTLELGRTPDIASFLDLEIAEAVHAGAIARLAAEKHAEGRKRERFDALRRFIWGNDREVSYDEVASGLQMTANGVKKAVFDLRQHYLEYFRATVAQSVSPELIDEETRYLMTLLAGSGAASRL